ncbi:MAG TPA: ATP-binding protein [Thermoplasmata archaeon]|nr:ATP-binding protein [Thermoplasmata archaeon]
MTDRGWFEATFGHGPMGALLLDPQGKIERTNRSFQEFVGLDEEPIGKRLGDLLAAGDEQLEATRTRAQHEQKSRSLHGFTLEALDRKRRHVVDLEFYPQSDESGGVTGILLVVHDRTGTHQENAGSARLFYQAFLHSTNAMELTDRDGFLIDVNPAFERIYGYSREEVIGRRPNVVASGTTDRAIYALMWKDLVDPKIGSWSGEIVNRDRTGVDHPVFLTISAIRGEDGTITHFLGVAVDLTAQRRLERQALHADRLVSLGQLAAGVAHEINTPLANIMLIAESVRRRTADPWTNGRIDSLLHQTDSAARIVRGLLDFARRPELKTGEVDLVDSVRAAVAFLRGKQSAKVALEVEVPAEPMRVHGDRDQVSQVITNLLNNAYDALDGEGRIVVRLAADPGWVHLSVSDNGPGIPPEVRAHLFEPFFTTKPEGKGTGLGLAICHGIVESHGGTIEVESEVGKGSTFSVHLPRLSAEPPAPATDS